MGTGTVSSITPPPRKGFWERLGRVIGDIIIETISTVCALASIAGVHHLVELWMGKDAKFFDAVPVEWAFDVAHLVVLGRLVWGIIKRFNDD
jgi:hypothetical protein